MAYAYTMQIKKTSKIYKIIIFFENNLLKIIDFPNKS